MKINDKIRIIRKARGLSQNDLGNLLNESGVSRQAISNWENGVYEPKLENIKDISKALNVAVDILIDDEIDLNNQAVLSACLNNDYQNDSKHKTPIYILIYKSYKNIQLIVGAIILALLTFSLIYGITIINNKENVNVEKPEPSQTIMGSVQNIEGYVDQLVIKTNSLENNLNNLSKYIIVVSAVLLAVGLVVFFYILFKKNRKLALLSQNSLIIYSKKEKYIKLDEIKEFLNQKNTLIIKTDNEEYKLKSVTNVDEVISFYNQINQNK